MNLRDRALEKFEGRTAQVGVVGLGYAGLPLACSFAEAGFVTNGFDIDPDKIAALRQGRSYIGHIPAERTARLVEQRRLRPANSFDALGECDAALICVPTPLDRFRAPDLTFVIDTAKMVARHLRPGQLIVLESTTYPGTTDEVLAPIFEETGLRVGSDFFLAFSPEREDPANPQFTTRTIPKVVGGVTQACGAVAAAAYRTVVTNVVTVPSARVAEAAKLLENVYRCVNIALVNELKLLFQRMSIDIWEVIGAASTKPFGFSAFYPGPGLGGHCIPVDPFYLVWKAREYGMSARFIELAGQINTDMPAYVIERLVYGLNRQGRPLRGAKILLIGVAYKRNLEDVRESPAFAIMDLLRAGLAEVSYHDPHVPKLQSRHLEHAMRSIELTPDVVTAADAVLIVTDHERIDYAMLVRCSKLIVDTRNATAPYRNSNDNIILA
jgi:UDP-N-acetyl-D-glucosamine dehydrogenase